MVNDHDEQAAAASRRLAVLRHVTCHLSDVVAMAEAGDPYLQLELTRLQARIGRLAAEAAERRMRDYLARPLSDRRAAVTRKVRG